MDMNGMRLLAITDETKKIITAIYGYTNPTEPVSDLHVCWRLSCMKESRHRVARDPQKT